jgi:hypothetical protein
MLPEPDGWSFGVADTHVGIIGMRMPLQQKKMEKSAKVNSFARGDSAHLYANKFIAAPYRKMKSRICSGYVN